MRHVRHVLLDFDFSGYRLGLTTTSLSFEVDLPDGSSLGFTPGGELDALPIRSAPVVGSPPGDQSLRGAISVEVSDLWAKRFAAPVQLATCRVYWWPEGELLRPEHEVYRGVLRDPQWQLQGTGRLGFSLVTDRRADDVAFPPSLVSDAGRFPSAPDDSKGYAVPVVYGRCSGLPLLAVSSEAGDPVRLLVAGHVVYSPAIQPKRQGADAGPALNVLQGVDGLGSAYSYVEMAQADYAGGSDVYAEEVEGQEVGGRPVTQLGDVLEHLVRTYGPAYHELDRARVEGARRMLNRISVGFFVNDRQGSTLLSFIQNRLAGQLPFVVSSAGGRLGWDSLLFPRGDDPFAVDHLVYGQNSYDRVGPTETSADDVLSDIELTYGFDGYQVADLLSLRFSPETSLDARRASSRWGRSPILSESAPDISEAGAAYLLLTDKAARLTRVRWRVEYQGVDGSWYFYPLQSVVLVTDADLGWVEEPCVVEVVEARKDGLCDVVLVTLLGV